MTIKIKKGKKFPMRYLLKSPVIYAPFWKEMLIGRITSFYRWKPGWKGGRLS